MKNAVFTLLFTFVLTPIWAQNTKSATYTGLVQSAKDQSALPYSNILILQLSDSSMVTGGISNLEGAFHISDIPFGTYLIKISSFGYKTQYISQVEFSKNQAEVDAGVILLNENVDVLGEVEVVAEKSEIQTSIDKKTFNVDKQLTAQGGTALDALQNVPSITIDMDGNVSLRGSANVIILIDGRPSSITGSGRQGALESIPASSIESVEIITNPSAKYDPDGMSGIINIILKKNKTKGFTGNVDVGIGNGINYNGAVNLAYRNEKLNVYGSYSINHYKGYRNFNQVQETWDDTYYEKLIQDRTGTHLKNSQMLKVGSDFYLKNKQTFGLSVSGNISDNIRTGDMIYWQYDSTQLTETWQRLSENPKERQGLDLNTYYEKKFKQSGRQLNFDANYSLGSNQSDGYYTENLLNDAGVVTDEAYLMQQNFTPSHYSTANIQLDYIHPTKNKGKWEMGYKSTFRFTTQGFYQETYTEDVGGYVEDDSLTNTFNYGEQVHAVYGIYGKEWDKFKLQIGLRVEQVFVDAKVEQDSNSYNNDYFSLYPTIHLVKPLSKTKEVSLSYSRRVNRPSMRSVNPFPSYTDPTNLRYGNPYLNPEYINSVELGYALYSKKVTLTSSVFYRYLTDMIQRVKVVETAGVTATTWQNIDEGHFVGLEAVVIYKPFKWWRSMASVNLSQNYLSSDNSDIDNSGFSWNANTTQTFTLKKDYTAQVSARYRSPMVLTQGRSDDVFVVDAAFKKSILKNALSFGLRLSDIFNQNHFGLDISTSNLTQVGTYKWQSRRVMFTVSYRFGQLKDNNQRQHKSSHDGNQGGGDDM